VPNLLALGKVLVSDPLSGPTVTAGTKISPGSSGLPPHTVSMVKKDRVGCGTACATRVLATSMS
jgi:hypothetical protein